jgi:hypothetical protein
MPLNVGLLQSVGDVFNQPPPQREDEEFIPRDDPYISALLEDDGLDPLTRAHFAKKRRDELQRQRLSFQLQKLAAETEAPDRGLVSWLGPIPVGFQLGTYLGMEPGMGQFLTDLVLDPVNLVGGLGGLTKLGRASKFLSAGGKAVTASTKAKRIMEGAEFLAKVTLDEELGLRLSQAAAKGGRKGAQEAIAAFKKLKKVPLSADDLKKLEAIDPSLVGLVKNAKEEFRGLKAAFELGDRIGAAQFKTKFLDRVLAGQSAFVNLSIPGTGIDVGGLRFPRLLKAIMGDSKPLAEAIEGAGKAAKSAVASAKLIERPAKLIGEALDPSNNQALLSHFQDTIDDVMNLAGPESLVRKFTPDSMTGVGVEFATTARDSIIGFANRAGLIGETLKTIFPDAALRKTLSFAREDPAKFAKTLGALNDTQKAAWNSFTKMLDDLGASLKDQGILGDVRDNYITHLVEVTNPAEFANIKDSLVAGQRISRRRAKIPKSRFGLERTFDTLADMQQYLKENPKAPFRLKTTDIAEVAQTYLRSVGTATVRGQALDSMQALRGMDNLPLALRVPKGDARVFGKLPRAIQAAKATLKDNPLSYERLPGLKVFEDFVFHKDVAKEMDALFSRSFFISDETSQRTFNKFLSRLNFVNHLGKGSLFGLVPFFHAASLVFSNFALLPFNVAARNTVDVARFLRATSDPAKQFEIITQMLTRSLRGTDEFGPRLIDARDMVRRALNSGMKLGSPSADTGYGALKKALEFASTNLPRGLNSPFTGLKHVNNLSDFNLWRVFHDGLKMQAWVHMTTSELRRAPGILEDAAKLRKLDTEVGSIVDAAFGGILDRLMIHPQWKDAARWAFLAPDWSLSNLMMARDMFVNMPGLRELSLGRALTRDVLMADLRFRAAAAYNIRAAFYMYTFGNVLNRAFTGRWLWENDDESIDKDTGLKIKIELPYKRADGRKQYMDISKQFAEPIKLVTSPPAYALSKMGVLPRVFRTLVLGQDSFGNPVYGTDDGPYSRLLKSIAATSGQFAPITGQSLVDVARGLRDWRSVGISTLGGVGVSSESREGFERKQRELEIKQKLREIR